MHHLSRARTYERRPQHLIVFFEEGLLLLATLLSQLSAVHRF